VLPWVDTNEYRTLVDVSAYRISRVSRATVFGRQTVSFDVVGAGAEGGVLASSDGSGNGRVLIFGARGSQRVSLSTRPPGDDVIDG